MGWVILIKDTAFESRIVRITIVICPNLQKLTKTSETPYYYIGDETP
jgi:hypothetical protein